MRAHRFWNVANNQMCVCMFDPNKINVQKRENENDNAEERDRENGTTNEERKRKREKNESLKKSVHL